MTHHHQHTEESPPRSSRTKWIFIGFLAVVGFFLFTEHRAHLYGALPYLLILACPLMHLFHGHGNHGGSHQDHDRSPNNGASPNQGSPTHDHGRNQS
ncbi:DUF2933 domain-containing protein [Herbaspirillum sp. HC18]|nr:DUF2933 domain-containing protein [Herbaspirillum sp. HC18]